MTFICLYFPGGVEEGESAFYLLTITFIFSTGFQVSAPLMNDRIWPNDRWAPCYDNSVDNRRQSPDNTVTQGRQFKMWWVFLWEFCFIVYTFCVFSFTPAQLNNQSRTLRSLLASYTVISKMITIRKRRVKNPDYAVPQIKTRIYKQAWMINLDSPVEVASDIVVFAFFPLSVTEWMNEWMKWHRQIPDLMESQWWSRMWKEQFFGCGAVQSLNYMFQGLSLTCLWAKWAATAAAAAGIKEIFHGWIFYSDSVTQVSNSRNRRQRSSEKEMTEEEDFF